MVVYEGRGLGLLQHGGPREKHRLGIYMKSQIGPYISGLSVCAIFFVNFFFVE